LWRWICGVGEDNFIQNYRDWQCRTQSKHGCTAPAKSDIEEPPQKERPLHSCPKPAQAAIPRELKKLELGSLKSLTGGQCYSHRSINTFADDRNHCWEWCYMFGTCRRLDVMKETIDWLSKVWRDSPGKTRQASWQVLGGFQIGRGKNFYGNYSPATPACAVFRERVK
jgi:hypothetical protein